MVVYSGTTSLSKEEHMKLQEAMAFIRPAIKGTPTLPVLEHVCISGGYLVAYNGLLAMCCPVTFPEAALPHAKTLAKAAAAVGGELLVSKQNNGKHLVIAGNGVTVNVPSTTDEFPMPDFQGTPVLQGVPILRVLKTLLPFTTDYEQRPWASTILLKGRHAWACNIVSAVRMELSAELPEGLSVVIPAMAAEALVATGEEPEVLYASETRFVAQLPGSRFVSAPTVTTPWPVLDFDAHFMRQGSAAPEGFFRGLAVLEGFLGTLDEVWIGAGGLKVGNKVLEGASFRVNTPDVGKTSLLSLRLIERYAKTICFAKRPIVWHGEGIEGIVNNKTDA